MNCTKSLFLLFALATSVLYAKDEDVLRPKGRKDGGGGSSSYYRSSSSGLNLMIGAEAGLNYNMFSQDAQGVPAGYPEVISKGSGIAPYLSLFADLGISRDIGFQLRVSYDMKDFSTSGTHTLPCPIFDEFNQKISDTTAMIDYKGTDRIRYVDIALLLRWNITPEFVVLFGPVYQTLSSSTKSVEQTILSPDSCYFNYRTPQQSKTFSTGEVSTENVVNASRLGIDIGIGYMIPISRGTWIVPRLGAQYFLTQTIADRSVNDLTYILTEKNAILNSLQAGVGLWFSLQ